MSNNHFLLFLFFYQLVFTFLFPLSSICLFFPSSGPSCLFVAVPVFSFSPTPVPLLAIHLSRNFPFFFHHQTSAVGAVYRTPQTRHLTKFTSQDSGCLCSCVTDFLTAPLLLSSLFYQYCSFLYFPFLLSSPSPPFSLLLPIRKLENIPRFMVLMIVSFRFYF